jgi:hypothetical protein
VPDSKSRNERDQVRYRKLVAWLRPRKTRRTASLFGGMPVFSVMDANARPTNDEGQGDETARVVYVPMPPKSSTTVYIYPGLISGARSKALMLDCQCPATIYRCIQCLDGEEGGQNQRGKEGGESGSSHDASCPHESTCPICMELFHAYDLVRVLPCSSQHIFHSRCILTWFSSSNRCPLCVEVIGDVLLSPESVSEVVRGTEGATEDSDGAATNIAENPRAPFHIQEMSTPVGRIGRSSTIFQIHQRRSTLGTPVSPVARLGFPVELTPGRVRRLPLARGFQLECSLADEQVRRQQALSQRANGNPEPPLSDEASSRRPEVHGSRAYSYIAHDSARMSIERTL